ncbi:MAG: glycosyltransferase family 4 protein [Cyanobacteria bacterium P01_F01_bin.42]
MKLAIITSHPVQYYAPWFRYLAQECQQELKVFYLWDFGVTTQQDKDFKTTLTWDIPLLDGYEHEFIENVSRNPGTSTFFGLNNPRLIQHLRDYNPDAVLMMLYNYAHLYPFIFRWKRCPILFRGDSHRLIPQTGWKATAKRQFIRQVFRQFAGVLYVGQANYRYFQDHGVPAQKLFFTPHSVDNQRFARSVDLAHIQAQDWKRELGIPPTNRVILFAGKFIDKKRPQDLIQAFQQARLDGVSLLLVGAGILEDRLKELAADTPSIVFAPFQNQSLMPRTLAIADLLVLPSYGAGETWGLIVNEAMNLGKPVVVSDHVGCAEDLVANGKNGYIFPAGDVSALAQALQKACLRSDLAAMGQTSRVKIQSYSYRQMSAGLQTAIARVAA